MITVATLSISIGDMGSAIAVLQGFVEGYGLINVDDIKLKGCECSRVKLGELIVNLDVHRGAIYISNDTMPMAPELELFLRYPVRCSQVSLCLRRS